MAPLLGRLRRGHAGEEGLSVLEEALEGAGLVDLAGDVPAVAGDRPDGGSFPSGLGGPEAEVAAVGDDAAEVEEALEEIGGEAEFDAERIEVGFELDEIEVAGIASRGGLMVES